MTQTRTIRAFRTFGEPPALPAQPKPEATRPKTARRTRKARERVPRLTPTEQHLGRHLVVAPLGQDSCHPASAEF